MNIDFKRQTKCGLLVENWTIRNILASRDSHQPSDCSHSGPKKTTLKSVTAHLPPLKIVSGV